MKNKKFTKFNPEGKETLTYGETLGAAMLITDPEDAKQYFEAYVQFQMSKMKDRKIQLLEMVAKGGNINVDAVLRNEAEQICKSNLAYYAGYYDDSVRRDVERIFFCEHPIFGSIEKTGSPTPEQAFNAGKNFAERDKS